MGPLTLKLVLGIWIRTTSSQKSTLQNGDNDDDDTVLQYFMI